MYLQVLIYRVQNLRGHLPLSLAVPKIATRTTFLKTISKYTKFSIISKYTSIILNRILFVHELNVVRVQVHILKFSTSKYSCTSTLKYDNYGRRRRYLAVSDILVTGSQISRSFGYSRDRFADISQFRIFS